MGKVRDRIDGRLREFIEAQQIYFVATAPSGAGGHVNVSPKGHADTFAVLDPRRVGYLDLTGSGAETLAHLRENGRVTIMFCAFDGPPDVVRLHGRGRIVLPDDAEFADLLTHFKPRRGARSIVVVDVERVSTSCGFAVPLFDYRGDRDLLDKWTDRKSDADLDEYHRTRNAESIDGLPALPVQ
jgi:predicted pyridoxine 5'-phosphate oxidase superfamily flavin-nucleotide-binding protein